MSSIGEREVSTGETAVASKTDVEVSLAETAPVADDEKSAKSTRSMKSVLSHKSNKSSGEQATDRPSTPLEVELAVISIPDVEEVKAPVSMEVEATVPPIEDTAESIQEAAKEVSSVILSKSAPASDASSDESPHLDAFLAGRRRDANDKAGVEPLKRTVSDISFWSDASTKSAPLLGAFLADDKAGAVPLKRTASDVSTSLLSKTVAPSPKSANGWVVVRDVAVALFDVAGDWIYFYFVSARITVLAFVVVYANFPPQLYSQEVHELRREHELHVLFCLAMGLVAIVGSVLGAWAALTSLGRCCHHKSICLYCTLPQLSLFLVPFHHIPVFVLVSLYDYTFFGRLSAAGAFAIFTSMVTLVNALATNKWRVRVRAGCYDDNTVGSEATSYYEEMV